FYTEQIQACDLEIERLYGLTRPDWQSGEVQSLTKRKKNSHRKNLPHNAEEVRQHLKCISGGKVLKNNTLKTKNRAGQAFRMAAQSVKQAECVFGVFYRRLKARLGPSLATVATAHAIARVVYRMLKYQVEYEPLNTNEYQRQYEVQQIKYLKKKAAKFGLQLVPT